MALILNIDTSAANASVCLAKDGQVLIIKKNNRQRDHASWLHPAMNELIQQSAIEISMLEAIAVTIGPGSYTGLRVGLAAAKGLCFAMEKPLITVSTLLVMASAVKNKEVDLLCPVIDARRMEVFTALYTNELELIKAPVAMLIDENSFAEELASKIICFSGSGSEKFQKIINNRNALFSKAVFDVSHMTALSDLYFHNKQFSDLAYIEPLYLKEFYTPVR